MRISLMPRVCSGLLCGFLLLLAGCSNPSSQNLASLSVTAVPTTLSVGGASILHAVAHLSDGTTQDVSSGTTWTLSNAALTWANPGDVVVVCADKHASVLAELEGMSRVAQAGAHGSDKIADPDYAGD